jgi:hypothetical protein
LKLDAANRAKDVQQGKHAVPKPVSTAIANSVYAKLVFLDRYFGGHI